MAEEAEKAETEEGPGKSKKKLMGIVGGAVGVILLAFVASKAMAPKEEPYEVFTGDYVAPVTAEGITVNLIGQGSKRFLALELQANFEAYDETYVINRTADLVYMARITDAAIDVAARRTVDEIGDETMREVFREELRREIEPILFPVHFGDAALPNEPDRESGVGPGDSLYESTLRTPLYDGKLFIDAPAGTLRIDDGPEYRITGEETDLRVEDGTGKYTFVDLTGLDPAFVGRIKIGTHGRVREILFGKIVIQ